MGQENLNQFLSDWIEQNRGLYPLFLDAFCIVNTQAQVVEFNDAFVELTGESYRKILKIGDFRKLLQSEQELVSQVLTTRQLVRVDEFMASTKAHPEATLIFSGVPIVSEQNELLGAFLTIRNVSAESELQKKYDERKKESVIDGLTQLYNKTYTESLLLRLIKVAIRSRSWVSVVMCDVDHFKKINDGYGHQAGDKVLATVATTLKKMSRDSDIIGRFGGEEFICVLPGTDPVGAKIFAERFRQRLSEIPIKAGTNMIKITASLGVCSFNQGWKEGIEPESIAQLLVHNADVALYEAKQTGRNKVCLFEEKNQKAA